MGRASSVGSNESGSYLLYLDIAASGIKGVKDSVTAYSITTKQGGNYYPIGVDFAVVSAGNNGGDSLGASISSSSFGNLSFNVNSAGTNVTITNTSSGSAFAFFGTKYGGSSPPDGTFSVTGTLPSGITGLPPGGTRVLTIDLTKVSGATYLISVTDYLMDEYKIDDYSQLNTTQPVLLLFPLGNVVDGVRTGAPAKDVRLTVSTETQPYVSANPDANPATPAYAYDSVSAWTSTSTSSNPHTAGNFPFSCASSFAVVTWKDEVPLDAESSSKYLVDYDSVSSSTDPRYSSSGIQSFVTPNTSNLLWNGNSITLFNGGDSEQVIKYLGIIINYYQDALSIIFSAGKPSSYVTFDIDYSFNIS